MSPDGSRLVTPDGKNIVVRSLTAELEYRADRYADMMRKRGRQFQ